MSIKLKFEIGRKILINANKSLHFHDKANRARQLRQLGKDIGESCEQKFNCFTVKVLVYPPTKRRMDPPNLYPTVKHLVDGLTDAGLWDDDDWKHLKTMSFGYGGLSNIKDVFIVEMIITEE